MGIGLLLHGDVAGKWEDLGDCEQSSLFGDWAKEGCGATSEIDDFESMLRLGEYDCFGNAVVCGLEAVDLFFEAFGFLKVSGPVTAEKASKVSQNRRSRWHVRHL